MLNFDEIIDYLLTESVAQENVMDAIKKRYEVGINYKADDDPKGSGYRVVQPVAYGRTASGNLVFRAFQPMGDTKSKSPSWKLFRLDRVTNWKAMRNRKFKEPPSDQYGGGALGKYNDKGDNSMSEVYLVANFHGMKNDALMKYNAKKRAEKIAQDPFYAMKKNMEKSVKGNSVDYIRKNVEDWQKSQASKEFKGNEESIYDMSKTKDYGDKEYQTTVGPIYKGNENAPEVNAPEEMDYEFAEKNGPVYKQKTDNTVEKDTKTIDNKESQE